MCLCVFVCLCVCGAVLVSIQGLVLVPEPYYNEAGYQKQIGTMEGNHNSKQVSLYHHTILVMSTYLALS